MPLAWTVFIQVLFCIPGNTLPSNEMEIPYLDKIVHVLIFAVFVASWCMYLKNQKLSFTRLKITFFWVFMAACFNGIIIEYVQKYFIPNRSFDKGDIIADILSAGICYGICNVVFLKESGKISTKHEMIKNKPSTLEATAKSKPLWKQGP